MKPIQRGFTLLELVIVVAIIGTLGAFDLFVYLDYTVAAKVRDSLSKCTQVRT